MANFLNRAHAASDCHAGGIRGIQHAVGVADATGELAGADVEEGVQSIRRAGIRISRVENDNGDAGLACAPDGVTDHLGVRDRGADAVRVGGQGIIPVASHVIHAVNRMRQPGTVRVEQGTGIFHALDDHDPEGVAGATVGNDAEYRLIILGTCRANGEHGHAQHHQQHRNNAKQLSHDFPPLSTSI